MDPVFSEPSAADYKRLAEQWLGIENLIRDGYGAKFDPSLPSLDLLQRVVDDGLLEPTNTYGLQCLGVALGRIMAENIEDLGWCMVEDESGRNACLRLRQTTMQIHPLTMISKRIERGERVSVRGLFEKNRAYVAERLDAVDLGLLATTRAGCNARRMTTAPAGTGRCR